MRNRDEKGDSDVTLFFSTNGNVELTWDREDARDPQKRLRDPKDASKHR